jgi:hypothetical protein
MRPTDAGMIAQPSGSAERFHTWAEVYVPFLGDIKSISTPVRRCRAAGGAGLSDLTASVGPDHPFMTRGLLPMADIHLERAEYAEAESLYRRALVIEKATLRGDAPAAVEAIAETNSSLAYLFAIQGKFGEAAEFAVQAVEIVEKGLITSASRPARRPRADPRSRQSRRSRRGGAGPGAGDTRTQARTGRRPGGGSAFAACGDQALPGPFR